ncbi:NYN domain-containing protein [Maricaulis sp.]|uniref:NYN domain-containing protein n=1 Tax=Maricaulis sp. TaxID=1486257 RepID=UPI002637DC05|nr:NYN domain-containing protein [Maricaulis sp.]
MRTHVYVDGFNLYYGALKGTPHKWLDLARLMAVLLPRNEIRAIKYFTARIQPRADDPGAAERQNAYLRALAAYSPVVETVFGHFLAHPVRMPLANPPAGGPRTVEVIRTEEKGSDVNLAAHLVDDAWRDLYDAAVIVSNDSDLAEPMRMVRRLGKTTGLVTPSTRRASQQLARHAAFKKRLRPRHLAGAQLPARIPGTNISKPREW